MIHDPDRRAVQRLLKSGETTRAVLECSMHRRLKPETAILQCLAFAYGQPRTKHQWSSLAVVHKKLPRSGPKDAPLLRALRTASMAGDEYGDVIAAERALGRLVHYGMHIGEFALLRLLYELAGHKPLRLAQQLPTI